MAAKKSVTKRRLPLDDGMVPITWVPIATALLCGLSFAANVIFAAKP